MAAWHHHPITPRQRIAIRLIESYVGVKFIGYNKGGASAFIGEHYAKAKMLRDNKGKQQMTNRQAVASLKQKKVLQEVGPWEED